MNKTAEDVISPAYNMGEIVADDIVCSDYESVMDGDSSLTCTEQDLPCDHLPITNEYRILFLGKTVAGKTTLCKLVAGGAGEASLRIKERSGQFLIEDDVGAIGQDGTSTTLQPTLIPCPSGWEGDRHGPAVVLCDCPGFGDTRGWNAEVRQLEQVRQVALEAAALKVVLVVEHASVMAGTCVDSFISLVEYAVGLLKHLDKYRASVCLVVNKVPATTRKVRDDKGKWHYELKQDEEFKQETRSFLYEVLRVLRGGLTPGGLTPGQVTSERVEQFVSDLLEDDRLALLRCPDEAVSVEECELLQDSKKGVLVLLREQLQWVAIDREDLGYPLSLSAGMEVSRKVQSLCESIPRLMVIAVQALKEHYVSLLQDRDVESAKTLLKEHMQCLQQTPGIQCETCFSNVDLAQLVQSVTKHIDELKRLQRVVDGDVVSGVELLVVEDKQAIRAFLEGWEHYFDFHEQLSDLVWSYDVQSRQSDFDVGNVVSWGRGEREGRCGEQANDRAGAAGAASHIRVTASNVRNFVSVLREQGLRVAPGLDEVEWEPAMLERTNALLAEALQHRPSVRRVGDAEVRIEGMCIVLSAVLPQVLNMFESGQITILAGDTVFVDCDVEATGKRLRMVMLAPRWEVTTECKFELDGSPAPITPRGNCFLRRSFIMRGPADRGSDGTPGEPGGSAGAFLGACAELINGQRLLISACGGRGGDGGDGTAGANGTDGADAVPAFFSESRQSRLSEPSVIATLFYNQRSRTFYGFSGQRGGDGGHGGKGGCGGLAGEVKTLLPGDSSLHVGSQAKDGEKGRDGEGGLGGMGGWQGDNLTGRLHFLFFLPVGVSTGDSAEESSRASDGTNGSDGANCENMIEPQNSEKFTELEMREALIAHKEMSQQPEEHLSHRRRTVMRKFSRMIDDQLERNVVSRWLSS